MATVVVSAAGGGHGIGAIQSLRQHTEHEIIGIDMDPHAGGLYIADEGYQIPGENADDWPTSVASIIDKHNVDVAILHRDGELKRLPSLQDHISTDVTFLAAKQEVINLTTDTYEMMQELATHDISIPETWSATEYDSLGDDDFPIVIKPKTGQGNFIGSGVTLVENNSEAESYLSTRDPTDLLLQEFITGKEYTSDVIGTQDNELLSVVPKEAVSENPYHRATRTAPSVEAACERVFKSLQPEGILNVQHIVSEKNGQPYLIEINPRFSHSSCLTVDAGINGYELLINDALDNSIETPDGFVPDIHMLEHSQPLFVEERGCHRRVLTP